MATKRDLIKQVIERLQDVVYGDQGDLAHKAGIAQETVSRLKNADPETASASLETIAALCGALGIAGRIDVNEDGAPLPQAGPVDCVAEPSTLYTSAAGRRATKREGLPVEVANRIEAKQEVLLAVMVKAVEELRGLRDDLRGSPNKPDPIPNPDTEKDS